MTTINYTANNLITTAITEQTKVKTKNNTEKPQQHINTGEKSPYTSSSDVQKGKGDTKNTLITNLMTIGGMIALFFLPELYRTLKYRIPKNIIKQAMNFKPLIGDTISKQTQNYMKNGLAKTTLENKKGEFLYKEIVILKNGKPNRRIIIKKEKMSNGKYKLKEMVSYAGKDILDNEKIQKNGKKYIEKEYKRSEIVNKEYTTLVKKKGQPIQKTKCHCTPDGEPILRINELETHKKMTAFLYDKDICVGTNTQIIPKDKTQKSYNVLTIPRDGIRKMPFVPDETTQPYDAKLDKKLLENF